MLAGTSKRSAGHMKNVYQGDSLGTFGLETTNVLVQKRAGMLPVGVDVSVSCNISIACIVINSFC